MKTVTVRKVPYTLRREAPKISYEFSGNKMTVRFDEYDPSEPMNVTVRFPRVCVRESGDVVIVETSEIV